MWMLRLGLILAVAFYAGCGSRTFTEDQFPSRSVNVNGRTYQYRIYLPKLVGTREKLPVMLYLHGSNRRGDDNHSQLLDLADTIAANPPNFIIVFPQCRGETFWAGEMTQQAIAALDQSVNELNGDDDRLYLAGYSMGGYGVWQTAITYPNKFAALVPIAGGILPNGEPSEKDKELLSPAVRVANQQPDVYIAFAAAIGKTPVWAFHGQKDEVVPVDGARKIIEALRSTGNQNVNYTELENVGHGSVSWAFSQPGLYDWLAVQKLH